MKKLLLAITTIASLKAFAQDYVGKNIQFLEGRELKVIPPAPWDIEYGYPNFFTDAKLQKVYKKQGTRTKAEAITGKVFKLISYTPNGSFDYVLKLENEDTGTLYYKYVGYKNTDTFPFEVIGESIPYEAFKDGIEIEKIWSDRTLKYEYFYHLPKIDDIKVSHSGDKTSDYQFKLLMVEPSDRKETINDVTIFLENKEELKFTVPVVVEPAITAGQYKYLATFSVTREQMKKLIQSKIVKYQMGNHIRPTYSSGLLMNYFRCLEAQISK